VVISGAHIAKQEGGDMKEGERTTWTPKREKALLKLGAVATACSKGIYKNWSLCRNLCPKESSILQDQTNKQLRQTYSRIVKASQGLCMYGNCRNNITTKHRYCKVHRKYMSDKASKHVSRKRRSAAE